MPGTLWFREGPVFVSSFDQSLFVIDSSFEFRHLSLMPGFLRGRAPLASTLSAPLMHPDPWQSLRGRTTARIALGRAGGSLGTAACLAFAADHADARDAVYSELDTAALSAVLPAPVLLLRSRAIDRKTYLHRPDLGRQLDDASVGLLENTSNRGADVVLIAADGLSAAAAQNHAPAVIQNLMECLSGAGISLAPLCVATQARVAIGDRIGSLLHARMSVILIGERPGLGLADSLGAYLTHAPAVGKTDADRNCVSNIHPQRLPPAAAARTLLWLIRQSLIRQLSGVALKDESAPALPVQSLQSTGAEPALD